MKASTSSDAQRMPTPNRRRPVRLVLELDASDKPIRGTLVEPERYARSFCGWLALTELIETVRAGDGHQGDHRRGDAR